MRQYEISCTIILQNLAQIKTMYKDDWESIVGNCDSFLFLGGQEYSTLEYISKLLGKTTVKTKSEGRSRSGKGGSSSTNMQRTGTELLATNQIATMPKDECVLIINGLNPFYDKKYDLTKHPHFAESGDADSSLKYDCKKEILNYGLQSKQNNEKTQMEKESNTIDHIVGESKTLPDVFKENKVETVKDAVNRIVLKKGEVIASEQINKDTGNVEFDYNIE